MNESDRQIADLTAELWLLKGIPSSEKILELQAENERLKDELNKTTKSLLDKTFSSISCQKLIDDKNKQIASQQALIERLVKALEIYEKLIPKERKQLSAYMDARAVLAAVEAKEKTQ